MRKILDKCPNCGGELEVTRLSCKNCETVILARYQPCRFCRLKAESLEFATAFLRHRGNLKEMERELGRSYWVLRAQLNDVIREMGFEVRPGDEAEAAPRGADSPEAQAADQLAARRAVLERLDRGEINAVQATGELMTLRAAAARGPVTTAPKQPTEGERNG